MNELLSTLLGILTNDENILNNFTMTKDEDGNYTFIYKKPSTPKEIDEFKEYIDAMDDELFEAACTDLSENDNESFKVISEEQIDNLETFNNAVNAFKEAVTRQANKIIEKNNKCIHELVTRSTEVRKYL